MSKNFLLKAEKVYLIFPIELEQVGIRLQIVRSKVIQPSSFLHNICNSQAINNSLTVHTYVVVYTRSKTKTLYVYRTFRLYRVVEQTSCTLSVYSQY